MIDGVYVVDKPGGLTSHDVVGKLRKLLGTRAVGHAGTLDPMATGVLLLLAGEATKLSPYLTLETKSYRAEVRFGLATDSLDIDGRVEREVAVPP
ncbi:MAG TPA: tRNA pseudouridine(55) synthase TruB, partial [Polyangiaceae bacterium]|nr:tRNA pseudouridine(55) synthase TruB [Polyangiaceae bacterium]